MSETKLILNSANDLLLVGDGIRNVPLKHIAQTSLKGLRRQESDIELYEILLTNIIHQFDPREFEAEVSCAILPELVCFLEKIQSEVQSNALSFFFVENLTILLRVAEVLLKLVEYLTEKEEQCQLVRSLVIFPEYLLRCYTIVRNNYATMAHESEALEAMKTLYAVCKKLLIAYLELLYPRETSGRSCNYFRAIDHEEEYDCLEKVCILLANVGNEISPIDSLLASDVWKAIVKLCTDHAEQSFGRDRTTWLGEIVTILNTGINTSFLDVQTKNEPTKQSTIALKLNAFFLRVMLKILTLSKLHTGLWTYTSIIRTLLEVKSCLRMKAICNELAAGIEQYLHIGYMAIVENSFRSESFAKALSQYDCKTQEETHSFFHLMMHIVTQLLPNANDSVLLSLYCKRNHLLQHVCSLLNRSDALLYHNGTLYKQLLVHCSALILMGVRLKDRAAQKMIEEALVRMVLQEHYYTALFGIDLWSIFVRYHSTQLMYAYFIFWKKINDHYSIFTSHPKQVHVRLLLRNLFVFLPVTHKEKLLHTFPATDSAHDRLWVALSPLPAEIDESKRKQFMACLEKRLLQSIKARQQAPGNVKVFYEVLTLLSISGLATRAIEASATSLWTSQLNWGTILKTTSASSIFDCLERNGPGMSLGTVLKPMNASVVAEAKPFVKYQVAKLIAAHPNPSTNVQSLLEVLLKDNVPFVKAFAFDVLHKLKDKQISTAQQLLSKQPQLQSQLNRWHISNSTKLPPLRPRSHLSEHRCQQIGQTVDSSQSLGSLMLNISSKVNELFPDDGDEVIQDIDVDMFGDKSSQTKKRKFDATGENCADDAAKINQCLKELQSQTMLLKGLIPAQRLQSSQKGQLQSIIATLTKVLES
ncbi:uncharacterized protein LOC128302459 [Anopheles moucheti]|uniref:uncharacterized protein LOC128302459 n=1 Tax=Anopheles moucheti TaxID=186751 RepID=UPI0022F119A4|nr:uncharacterized protein LOC128302459 [Anopheles moucheti]XP_052895248.1 uncharacterized protein LOC128302459 [Anopheles moucheti]